MHYIYYQMYVLSPHTVLYKLDYLLSLSNFFFFFNYTATTEIYTLSLHDALPISLKPISTATPANTPRAQSTLCSAGAGTHSMPNATSAPLRAQLRSSSNPDSSPTA